ncbi:MAG: hypothetical protein V2A34_02390, partial [Lentisphaerota bacterium]
MENKPKSSNVPFWIAIALLSSVILLSLAINMGFVMAMAGKSRGASGLKEQGEDEFPQMDERWTYGKGKVKAAHILFTGVISREMEQGLFSMPMNQVESVLRQIKTAQNDEDVKAILFEVDSPGGEVTPADE